MSIPRKPVVVSLVAILALIACGSFAFFELAPRRDAAVYRTATVKRGDIRATISATGTVEPEEVVDVGAQVLGRIESRGRDPRDSSKTIDYMSQVEEGTVLAQIDASVYRAQVEQTKAAVAQAEANVVQQQALLDRAERDWIRAQDLRKKGNISDADYDLAHANVDAARALLGVNTAAVDVAKANHRLADINLGYTTIVSPVKGVIIDRRVNVGQTVVSSLTAPSLFLIAKDLKRLQVWASVNEADVGQVHNGQRARFTVDAYPNEEFVGEVTQIRLNAIMTQNVVTYTVVVITDNSSGRLLPYLTANLNFEVDSKHDVLLVPNAALRFSRENDLLQAEAARPASGGGGVTTRDGSGFQEGNRPKAIDVVVGLSNGTMTEVQSEEIHEGNEVLVGEVAPMEAGSQSSPFAPKMFGGRSGR